MSAKKSLPRGALARAEKVLAALQARYPRPATHLEADNAWELLVATVLAAQCTDARVNTVTPELFRRWPGPAELALATQDELESVIRSTGFYHSKARNLLGAVSACYAIEQLGTQEHLFSKDEFRKRYEASFGPLPITL